MLFLGFFCAQSSVLTTPKFSNQLSSSNITTTLRDHREINLYSQKCILKILSDLLLKEEKSTQKPTSVLLRNNEEAVFLIGEKTMTLFNSKNKKAKWKILLPIP